MRGLRARIGVIQLNSAMMDHEFWEMTPEGVSIFCTRLRGHPPEIAALKSTASDLVDLKPNSMLYACTSGSFGPGPEWNALLIRAMQEVTGVPATTSSEGVVRALQALGAKRISVSTPYDDEYTQKLKVFLEARGFIIAAIKRHPDVTNVVDDYQKFLWPPKVAYDLAKETYTPGSDAHLISCAGWRTLPIIERLENDIGVPVVTSAQAAMWHAMKLAGLDVRMKGKGKLLQI